MSYLDTTVLNDFQADQATNEKFKANYGLVDLAKDSTPFTDYIPTSVEEKLSTASASRDALIPVIKDQTVTVTSVPGFSNIPINLGETDNYFFTAVDLWSGFRMYPASFENNQLDAAFYRDNVIKNVFKAMAVAKDDLIEATLETRKTQVLSFITQISQGEGTFTFNSSTDTLEISKAAQKDTMFTYLNELMMANQLEGDYRIVTSPAGLLVSQVEALKNREGQAEQLLWSQSAVPPDRRDITNQISPSSDNFKGFFCTLWRFRNGLSFHMGFSEWTMFGGKEWSVTATEMPFIRSRINVFVNKEATEATSIITPNTDSNLIMTHFEEMAMWDRFYIVYRYNSDLATRQNGVVKILGSTS